MKELGICVGCLATNVKIKSMKITGLLEPYQQLTSMQTDGVPKELCWECSGLVNKFNTFRLKCERARTLLQHVYIQHGEISKHDVQLIDRNLNLLQSSLIIVQVCNENIPSTVKYKKKSVTPAVCSSPEKNDVIKESKTGNDLPENKKNSPLLTEYKFENVLIEEEPQIKLEDDSKEDRAVEVICEPIDNNDDYSYDTADSKSKTMIKSIGSKKKLKKLDFKASVQLMTAEEASAVFQQKGQLPKYHNYKYTCAVCNCKFFRRKFLENHQRKHDEAYGAYECCYCKLRFITRKKIKRHLSFTHKWKFTCDLCSKITYTRDSAKRHYDKHISGKIHAARKRKQKKKKRSNHVPAEDFNTIETIMTQEEMMAVVSERQHSDAFRSAKYKCELCYKPFGTDRSYSNHKQQHDQVSGTFMCDMCKLRYHSRRKMYKHITNNHMVKYSCKTCSHICYNRSSAKHHHAWHKGVTYTCHICGFTAAKMTSYLSHLRIKHPSQHICGQCGESFVSKMGLYHHTMKMHSVKLATDSAEPTGPYCSQCNVQFASVQAWTKHILISPVHTQDKNNVLNACHICGEKFDTASELKRHKRTKHARQPSLVLRSLQKKFPVKCSQCDEMMASYCKYWTHFKRHHAGKQFPLTNSSFMCEFCGQWFLHKSALEKHAVLIHSDKKPVKRPARVPGDPAADRCQFTCDVCNRQFKHKHSLTNHFRTHTVERPHTCPVCGKSFAYDCNLKRHELTAHFGAPTTSALVSTRMS